MQRALLTILLLTLIGTAQAQPVRYVSDTQYVPLRSGPGNDYRIVHRGIPSGTKMTVGRTSDDSTWSEITTARGTSGWIRSQYLMTEVPAALKLAAAEERASTADARAQELQQQLQLLKTERSELGEQVTSSNSELEAVTEELAQLKQISGKAVQLDTDNRRLVEDSENLRSEAEMLEAENLRLQDKLRSESFINGAMAVLLGVIIALVVPRLTPRKRRNSSWA